MDKAVCPSCNQLQLKTDRRMLQQKKHQTEILKCSFCQKIVSKYRITLNLPRDVQKIKLIKEYARQRQKDIEKELKTMSEKKNREMLDNANFWE